MEGYGGWNFYFLVVRESKYLGMKIWILVLSLVFVRFFGSVNGEKIKQYQLDKIFQQKLLEVNGIFKFGVVRGVKKLFYWSVRVFYYNSLSRIEGYRWLFGLEVGKMYIIREWRVYFVVQREVFKVQIFCF